jgi:hypothetical protein
LKAALLVCGTVAAAGAACYGTFVSRSSYRLEQAVNAMVGINKVSAASPIPESQPTVRAGVLPLHQVQLTYILVK